MTKIRMKRISVFLLVAVAAVVLLAWQAAAQSSNAGGQTAGQAGVQPDVQSPPPATPPPATLPPQVSPQAAAALESAKEKARKAPPDEVEKAEKGLREEVKGVDAEASAKGDMTVAQRFGGEFGMTPDALISERAQFKTGWGDLMVAHTLLANAKTTLTIDQLYQMRTEGMGWGQIAHGLDLKLGGIVSAVKAEARVASGLTKPDGKPAAIPPANAHAGEATKVNASAGSASKGKVGAEASATMGAGTSQPRGHSGK